MEMKTALRALAALSQSTRLEAFRCLVKAGNSGMPAGELATTLAVRGNTLSTHLALLSNAALVSSTREGRVIRYHANFATMRDLLVFLLHDCCQGENAICDPVAEALRCC